MDKDVFGLFIANLRKEKNMTQKELADRLMISDKAVSKWERGLSYPDITLLEPISLILDVSINELVQGRKNEMNEKKEEADVEIMVRDTLSAGTKQCDMLQTKLQKLRILLFGTITCLAITECLLLFLIGVDMMKASLHFWTVEGLVLFFGIYFWIFAKEKIPVYYDENKISCYSDGFFQIHVPGVYINNSNWPHIVQSIRIWSGILMVGYPILTILVDKLPINGLFLLPFILIVVFSVFIPVVYMGKKYQ